MISPLNEQILDEEKFMNDTDLTDEEIEENKIRREESRGEWLRYCQEV